VEEGGIYKEEGLETGLIRERSFPLWSVFCVKPGDIEEGSCLKNWHNFREEEKNARKERTGFVSCVESLGGETAEELPIWRREIADVKKSSRYPVNPPKRIRMEIAVVKLKNRKKNRSRNDG